MSTDAFEWQKLAELKRQESEQLSSPFERAGVVVDGFVFAQGTLALSLDAIRRVLRAWADVDADCSRTRTLQEVADRAALEAEIDEVAAKIIAIVEVDLACLPGGGVSLPDLEDSYIRQAFARTGGSISEAAKLVGLSRHAMRYRLETLGLVVPKKRLKGRAKP